MQTRVACPKCGQRFDVQPELLGRRLRCLQCQHVFAAQAGPAPRAALQSKPSTVDPSLEEEPSSSRSEARIHRTDHGVPGYLWPFAALPWGLLLLALGGCLWGVLAGLAAAALSAAGVALIQARQLSVGLRLVILLALDGVAGLVLIAGGLGLVIGLSTAHQSGPGPAPAPAGGPAPASVGGPAPNGSRPSAFPSTTDAPVRPLFTQRPRVFLADMQEYDVKAGPWPFSKNGQLPDGRPIKVNGVPSPKGLSMHPPWAPGVASVRYRLGKQAMLFRATVAINDTTNWCWSPATFSLIGDGKPLWQSVGIAHNHDHSQKCSVDVSGVDVLELRVQVANGSDGVHAVWVEPRLLQKADTPDQ